mmetsp:Transcript_20903/g.37742  ORF Transcript_20903/g.37742 Transcript_20903/m.37742 type:complete len:360 (+) Transcript_20903:257-1336(+)|eukprot:CAMPEP_0201884782 /NCGR_PEP_ID=MMETSP0902-20130614/17549_1 /ASSEMBLY_ACC=CAM_ASM_000551 /TAXON_ID=420261 /ORGANISM="Thalassiosira antarctica, Strain CCMP982" /LENGTH=359 /DNA_ID=CAMNT_0048413791 /DNA_START=257 /DNA_END=1336 /DNA_ORIENTATION=-
MAYNEDSSNSGHDEPWIQWFCGLKGHEMFCQVERAYIEDGFNLYGLRACVSNFSDCLDLILDRIGPEDSDDSHLTQSACTLYGLIHARYIVTTHGLDSMYNKYAAKEFGTCPLVQCNGQPVLPVGLRDEIGVDTAKIFCPKCKSVYQPPPIRSRSGHHSSNGGGGGGAVDGAAFGTTFPHLFLMTFNNLVPDPLPPNSAYIPRVFGFRVNRSAHRQGGGGSAHPALSNNGRRGGASYAQRVANMTSTRAAAGGGSRGAGVPVQETTAVVAGAEAGTAAAKPATLTPKAPKKPVSGNDGAAAVEGEDGAKEMATAANDGGDGNSNSPKKRVKSDGGKNSGSSNENGANKKKRQKRGVDVS